MLESSYNLLFGKLVLKSLFEDYFDAANHFSTIFLLKPIEDRHVDLVVSVSFKTFHYSLAHNVLFNIIFMYLCFIQSLESTFITNKLKSSLAHIQVSGPLDNKPEEPIVGNALFRWQRYYCPSILLLDFLLVITDCYFYLFCYFIK